MSASWRGAKDSMSCSLRWPTCSYSDRAAAAAASAAAWSCKALSCTQTQQSSGAQVHSRYMIDVHLLAIDCSWACPAPDETPAV